MRLALLSLAVMLTACATKSPEEQAKRANLISVMNSTRPTCEGEADCRAKWEAAQLWVVKNAGFKVQISNATLIETYNSPKYSTDLAARVTKEPLGGGRYKIVGQLWCANTHVCYPDPVSAAISFNAAVSQAKP